jgi:hypothetical protein
MQPRRALTHAEPSPLVMQGTPGRMYGFIYLPFIGFADLGDDAAIRRIHIGELPFPGHKTTINVILDMVHEIH